MRGIVFDHVIPQTETHVVTSQKKERIGILGGTFNPPHLGHLVMAEQVGNQLGLDRVLFLPTHIPPHKESKDLASSEDRKEMILRAIENNELFELDETDLLRKGKSYTYDTIQLLKEKYPASEFYFIIGGDMVEDLANWHKIDQLVKLVQFVGVKRAGHPVTSEYPVIWVDSPNLDISSTMIRKKIKEDCTVKYLVPEQTLEYIKQKRLYKDDTYE